VSKKVFIFNLNVGSAIEYAGEIFIQWVQDIEDDISIKVYKEQTTVVHTMNALNSFKPDLIVVNEEYHRVFVCVVMYKIHNPDVKVIYVNHCWPDTTSFRTPRLTRGQNDDYEAMWNTEMLRIVDHMFCINSKPSDVEWLEAIGGRVSNRYYPTDDKCFKVITPWNERKMFFYIGNIIPHKLSQEFLDKIVDTDIKIDCYGKVNGNWCTNDYIDSFDKAWKAGNINWLGYVPQDKVPEIMNSYKYLVMPHRGYEPFNWVLKQCMYCGTIPLVTNDRQATTYYGKWIDWAEGLYLGCVHTDDFISNLIELEETRPDHSGISEYLTYEVRRRFPYQEFKEEFQEKVRELVHG